MQGGSPSSATSDDSGDDLRRYIDAKQYSEDKSDPKQDPKSNTKKLTPAAVGPGSAHHPSDRKNLQQGVTPKTGLGSAGGRHHGSGLPPSGPSNRKWSPMVPGLALAPTDGGGGITPLNTNTRSYAGSSDSRHLKSTSHSEIMARTGRSRHDVVRRMVAGEPSSGKHSPTSSVASSGVDTELGTLEEGLSPEEGKTHLSAEKRKSHASGEEDDIKVNDARPQKKKSRRMSTSQSPANLS